MASSSGGINLVSLLQASQVITENDHVTESEVELATEGDADTTNTKEPDSNLTEVCCHDK